jgi:hypothetical protein
LAAATWNISGQYYETCSCDFVCPCILSQMTAAPTKGACTFAMAFKIDRGAYGSTGLDGLAFVLLGRTPEAMGKGDWSVGVIVDDRASSDQQEAITTIVSGAAGGPMSLARTLVTNFAGVQVAPIQFDRNGVKWAVTAGSLVDMAATGAMGLNPQVTEPMHITNTGHPASDSLALCHATKSHVEALGFTWHDGSGGNNGHYAPFAWSNA